MRYPKQRDTDREEARSRNPIYAAVVVIPTLVIGGMFLMEQLKSKRAAKAAIAKRKAANAQADAERIARGMAFEQRVPRPPAGEVLPDVEFGPSAPLECPAGATSGSTGCVRMRDEEVVPIGPQLERLPGGFVEGTVLNANGVADGPWYRWNEYGWLVARGRLVNGKRDGWFAGAFDGEKNWQEGRFIDGKRSGEWVVQVGGTIIGGEGRVPYAAGRANGVLLANACSFTFVDGVLEGPAECGLWKGTFTRGEPTPLPEARKPEAGSAWVQVP